MNSVTENKEATYTSIVDEWEFDKNVVLADGFDECIVGKDYADGRAVYSIERMLESMLIQSEMSMEEAIEYFDFNIGTAYVGEMTPIYIWQGESYNS